MNEQLKNALNALAVASSNVMDLLRQDRELFDAARRIDTDIDELIECIKEEKGEE